MYEFLKHLGELLMSLILLAYASPALLTHGAVIVVRAKAGPYAQSAARALLDNAGLGALILSQKRC